MTRFWQLVHVCMLLMGLFGALCAGVLAKDPMLRAYVVKELRGG